MENYYGRFSTITVGPWGGQDGDHWDDGVYSTVRQLEIAHGTGIDSIRVEYDRKGTSVWSEKHGGDGGNKTDKIKLEYPEEFLTSIHGHYGSLKGWEPILIIKSLTLISNKRTYGPYGTEEGTYFSLPMIGGKIVGFHGNGGWYLDAIGIHLEPIHKQNPQNSVVQYSQSAYATNDSFGYSMIEGNLGKQFDVLIALRQKDEKTNDSQPNYFTRKNPFTVTDQPPKQIQVVPPAIQKVPYKNVQGVFTYGPWGGTGGTMFDDSIYDGVRQIKVKRNVGIASVRVCYDFKGEAIWGSRNGGTGSFKKDLIVFDFPSEILTHITGYHGPTMVMGPNVIKSLTFHTTKTKYGPYGEEQGNPFSTNLNEGKIVGFHGKKGLFLDAIGVHVMEGKVVAPKISSPAKVAPPVSSPTKVVVPAVSASTKVVHPTKSSTKSSNKPEAKTVPPINSATKVVPPVASPTKPPNQQNELVIKEVDTPKWSFIPGKRGVSQDQVKLDFPHEALTRISGYYGPISKEGGILKVIKSLTFYTSRRKCGPFGEELGTYFTSATTEGKVVGLHGRSSMYLDAIGVHMQHWLGNQKPKQSSIMKMFS